MCSKLKEFSPAVEMNAQTIVSVRPTLLVLLWLSCALVSLTVAQGTNDKLCDQPTGTTSTCMCQTESNQLIDLTPLAKNDKTAKFTGIKSSGGYTYEYNPCTPFTDGNKCKDVFLCQTQPAKSLIFTAANQNEQIFKEASSEKYYVHYDGPGGRDTKVYLNCDKCNSEGSITSVNDATQNQYVLQLHSCHACPGGCSSGCGHGGGGGRRVQAGYIGIVLIIVIIAALVTYFIVGAVLLKFHFNASGTDIVPNKSFWFQLPLLVKDGCVFTFGPCVKFIGEKAGRRNDYQKI